MAKHIEKIPMNDGVALTFEELESITTTAREASTEFLGMGFDESCLILTYESKPVQMARIVEVISIIII